jgi:hypothetical protein
MDLAGQTGFPTEPNLFMPLWYFTEQLKTNTIKFDLKNVTLLRIEPGHCFAS